MPRRKSRSSYKGGKNNRTSFATQKEKDIIIKNIQLFQDGRIKSLKEKSRKATKQLKYLKYKEYWNEKDLQQVENFLDFINKQRKKIDENIINWDLLGTDFLDKWESKHLESTKSLLELGMTREEIFKGVLSDYHQVLYFFAVVLPSFSPDKDSLIIYRGIGVTDTDKYIDLLQKKLLPEKWKGLGKYWTWNPDSAFVHSADISDIRFMAKTPINNIDWEETILRNMDSMFGMFGSDPEYEIDPYEGVEIPLIAVEKIKESLKGKMLTKNFKLETEETIPISSRIKYRIDGNKV